MNLQDIRRRHRQALRAPAVVLALASAGILPSPLQAQTPVRAWEGEIRLPTYREDAPDPNPAFDFFEPDRINYPYTLRTNLSDEREERSWRALFLENEYLRCSVLPDLGGHLYGCTDLLSGEEMFYANPSIKLSRIGYRGAWAALGIEFNFPVSHNWVSTSPVDYALVRNADGSASVWVGNVDRVFGTSWRVELRLRPGRAQLEQHTTLYNRSDFRHRYYWWTNAAVEVRDSSRILYPQRYTASHGFTDVDTWPVDRHGTDNSVLANQIYGPVSRFSHGSREPFMTIYHPDTNTGTVHWSDPADLPAKKFWSWGVDARALAWREALSDDSSAYVEIQAGLFRNQETYAFLEPQDDVRFTELWTPVRELGGVTRATPDAVLSLSRPTPGRVEARLNVVRAEPDGRLVLTAGPDTVLVRSVPLDPGATVEATVAAPPEAVTVTLWGPDDRVLLTHTEGVFDFTPDSLIRTGPQAVRSEPADRMEWTEAAVLEVGDAWERDGRRLRALALYDEARTRLGDSPALARAAGRLHAALGRDGDAIQALELVLTHESTDAEAAYHLGLTHRRAGNVAEARLALERAHVHGSFRAAAGLALTEMAAASGDLTRALELVRGVRNRAPGSLRAAAIEVALLRRSGEREAAAARMDEARGRDPTDLRLRYEALRLGRMEASDSAAYLAHLAGESERILDLARQSLALGDPEEAEHILALPLPPPGVPSVVSEPGAVHPDRHPLVSYYRAWVAARLGRDAGEIDRHLAAARTHPIRYVFPNRPRDRDVLGWAVGRDPSDGRAWHLVGSIHLAAGEADRAVDAWERARTMAPDIPTLHRNLGRTLLRLDRPVDEARTVLTEGLEHDAENVDLYVALDTALVRAGRSSDERAQVVLAYPDADAAPAPFVYHAARVLSGAGRHVAALALFHDRFFPAEEGGTDPRRVYLDVQLARVRSAGAARDCGQVEEAQSEAADPGPRITFVDARYQELLVSDAYGELRPPHPACPGSGP